MSFWQRIFGKDKINFKVRTDYDEDEIPWLHTEIFINNRSLFQKLIDYENFEASRTQTDPDLVGKYIGIDPVHIRKTLLKCKPGSEISLWQCSKCRSHCSVTLVCKVRIKLLYVELYDFRQIINPIPFNGKSLPDENFVDKTKWNYETFGPFVFNTIQFYREIISLK